MAAQIVCGTVTRSVTDDDDDDDRPPVYTSAFELSARPIVLCGEAQLIICKGDVVNGVISCQAVRVFSFFKKLSCWNHCHCLMAGAHLPLKTDCFLRAEP